jgi:hypothetical protein
LQNGKALYALKSVPRAWSVKIDEHSRASGFQRSTLEFNLYIKKSVKGISVFVIYVDDVIITGSGTCVIYDVREDTEKALEITDLGLLHCCFRFEL